MRLAEVYDILKQHSKALGIEWLDIKRPEFYKTTVLCRVLSGRSTNMRDLSKFIINVFYDKRIDISPKLFSKMLMEDTEGKPFHYTSLKTMLRYEMKPNKLINKYLEASKKHDPMEGYHTSTVNDVISQLRVLGRKFNFTWSAKRIETEHRKMTKELLKLIKHSLSVEKIEYPNISKLHFPYPYHIIDNEYEAYLEGSTQHNCIYTNYWGRIKAKAYLIIAFETEEGRVDAGITRNGKADQIYKAGNAPVGQQIKDKITNWVKQEEVQKAIKADIEDKLRVSIDF
jgi:hypothetical protein